jgi:transposase
MSRSCTRRRSRARRVDAVQKPGGTFHPRVQKVGPEHFGIVSVDCAKARSKWMLADFFGTLLIPPTTVEHRRPALDAAVEHLRQAMRQHDLHDVLVAIERTGRYHHVVRHAFAAAGFETRIVHPFATSRLRQPSDPGNKTDDTDLAAIHRAAVNGFALIEHGLDEAWSTLQILIRHRRSLVTKSATLRTQIREHLDAAFPGFAACFEDLWERDCAWHLVRHFASATELHAAGLDGLCQSLNAAGIRYQRRTLDPVLQWAAQAAPPDFGAAARRRCALALDDDRRQKDRETQALERDVQLPGHIRRPRAALRHWLPLPAQPDVRGAQLLSRDYRHDKTAGLIVLAADSPGWHLGHLTSAVIACASGSCFIAMSNTSLRPAFQRSKL